jgi:excisionase family DNA binding protein
MDEIAEHLDVRRDTLTRVIKNKGFPGHLAGKKWRFISMK